MSFTSVEFVAFFVTVVVLYWALPRRFQNPMLLVASYAFYASLRWWFPLFLAASTVVDYVAGIRIEESAARDDARTKRLWLFLSLVSNLGLLGVFKYFDFFLESVEQAASLFGVPGDWLRLEWVWPIGISFYTFQKLSYAIDIYRGTLKPTRRPLDFALFVAFFPKLVAGPIERASSLLPQILGERRFESRDIQDGVHLIFWGLFKKVYVADNLALFVNEAFQAPAPSTLQALCAVYAYALQIYCDFSGYSDMARGFAKCLGFRLHHNFNHPYAAVNPQDFWRRWHITLSTWLRDYLYIPLGGSRKGRARTYGNLGLTMLLGGLWHGAAVNFVLWGAYHGTLLIAHRALKPLLDRIGGLLDVPAWTGRLVRVVVTFHLVCFGWLLFRAHSWEEIVRMVQALCAWRGVAEPGPFVTLLRFGGPLVLVEIAQYFSGVDDLHRLRRVPAWVKCIAYAVFFYLFAFYGGKAQGFIYQQF